VTVCGGRRGAWRVRDGAVPGGEVPGGAVPGGGAPGGGAPGGGVRSGAVLAATSLAAFTATLDNTVVAVALRDVQDDLGAGVTGLQGVVTAYTVALAALLLTGGALADVFGRRRIFLAGLAVFGGASVGCATTGTIGHLLAWRVLQGIGAALVLPGGLALLAGAYPDPVRRARAVGVWAATGGLALVAGPVVGGLLVAAYGWRAVFWVNVPLALAVAVVAVRADVPPQSHERRLDVPGSVLTAVVLGATTYAVVLAGRDGLGRPVVLALGTAAVALVLLVLVERRAPDPVLPLPLLRQRAFLGSCAGAFAASLAVFLLLVFLSLFLQLVQARDALPSGLLLLPLTVGLVLTAPVAARWSARRGPGAPVVLGLLLAGGAMLGLGQVLTVHASGLLLGLALGVAGVGVGLTTAPVVAASLEAVATGRSGLAAAGVNVARELGGMVAVAGLGALAVSRLAAGLTRTLVGLGVHDTRPVVDALLGARTGEATGLLLGDLGLQQALQSRDVLLASAETSFTASTRVALSGGGLVLLAVALLCAGLLRPAPATAPGVSLRTGARGRAGDRPPPRS